MTQPSTTKRPRNEATEPQAVLLAVCQHNDEDEAASMVLQRVTGVTDQDELDSTVRKLQRLMQPHLEEHDLTLRLKVFPLDVQPELVWRCVRDFATAVGGLVDTPAPSQTLADLSELSAKQLQAVGDQVQETDKIMSVLRGNPLISAWLAHDIDDMDDESEEEDEEEDDYESAESEESEESALEEDSDDE